MGEAVALQIRRKLAIEGARVVPYTTRVLIEKDVASVRARDSDGTRRRRRE
jgi:hypothetical protein